MAQMAMNEIVCPYCNQSISEELYNDHFMCHQVQEEDFNLADNINPARNNPPNYNSNQNQNQNLNPNNINNNNIPPYSNSNNDSNNNNNQNESIFSKVYDIFTSPFKSNNSSNSSNDNNNNNKENQGFFSSLFCSNSNSNNNSELNNNNINNGNNNINRINENNNINNNNRINNNNNINSNVNNNGINSDNNNNNNQQEETSIFKSISNSISNAFNSIGENYNKLKKRINEDIEASYMPRTVFLDNNPVRLMRNNRRIISDYNISDENYILIGVPIQNYNQGPIRNYNDYINAQRLFLPPIIVGERGHIIDINNYNNNLINENNENNNQQLNENEFNQIMQSLPSTIVNEKKEGEQKECVICLAEFEIGESITTLPCLHVFHTECIKSWIKSKNHCPICKFEITLNSIMREN